MPNLAKVRSPRERLSPGLPAASVPWKVHERWVNGFLAKTPRPIRIEDFSKFFPLSHSTIQRWAAQGKIPGAFRKGRSGHWRVPNTPALKSWMIDVSWDCCETWEDLWEGKRDEVCAAIDYLDETLEKPYGKRKVTADAVARHLRVSRATLYRWPGTKEAFSDYHKERAEGKRLHIT